MRQFLVYLLILGVVTLTAPLTQAELPGVITADYAGTNFFSIKAQAEGGDLDAALNTAKLELAQNIFKNTSRLLNPEHKPQKNKWEPAEQHRILEAEYSAARYNLNPGRIGGSVNAHLMQHFQEAMPSSQTSNSYRFVNIEQQKFMKAYVEREKALQQQINTLLARAKQAEAMNQQQALDTYLQTLPIYEQLKEAVLLQHAVQENPDVAAVHAKLLDTATGTNGGALQMALPEVSQRVHQLQNQGRLVNTVDTLAKRIAYQLSIQTKGMQKGTIKIDGFRFRGVSAIQHSSALQQRLTQLLEQDGWSVFKPPPTRALRRIEKVSLTISGDVHEPIGKSESVIRTTISDSASGDIVGNARLMLDSNFASTLKPANHETTQKRQRAHAKVTMKTVPQQEVITDQKLRVDVWTDKQTDTPVYREGENATIYCMVNQPAYVRLIYAFQDGQLTLLHDSIYIDASQVGKPVKIDEFEVAPPFGNEELYVLAQKTPFESLQTTLRDGYYFLRGTPEEIMDAIHAPPTRALKRKSFSPFSQAISMRTEP